MPPLMVSVWDTQTRLAIAQARAPGGNEIKATLDLLHSLVLKGCTVTGDALHCHPQMAQAIIAAKAHYVLGLKANHGPLFAVAQQGFAAAGAGLASFASEERRHGPRQAPPEARPTLVRPVVDRLMGHGRRERHR